VGEGSSESDSSLR